MNGRLEGENNKKNKTDNILLELPDYVDKWVISMRASEKTESSIQDYVQKVRKFLKYIDSNIKELPAEKITADVTCEYFISLRKKEKNGEILETSDSYKITNWNCLNNFLGFMAKRGYIKYNYMTEISKPKNNDLNRINRNRIELTQKDFNNIIKAVNNGAGTHRARARQKKWKERDMAIFLLFMTTGMRETALSQINIEDIDFANNTLIVRDKGDKEHEYTLKKHTINAINRWLEVRKNLKGNELNALFINNKGTRLAASGIAELVLKYSEAGIGYKIRPHKLRAGFCTILYNMNPDILFVSNVVGHSSIDVTRRYIVTKNTQRDKASDMMDGIFSI